MQNPQCPVACATTVRDHRRGIRASHRCRGRRIANQVFSLHHSAEIHNYMNGAGFSNVPVQAGTKPLPLLPPDEFLWQHVRSTSPGGAVAKVNDRHCGALESDAMVK